MSDTVKLNHCPKCGAPIPAAAPQGLCPKCVLLGAATATDAGVPATATSEIPSLARVAAAFPQLEILELIGRGGMGFVFKARQPHLDRFVALKLLPDKLARDPRFAERFNREGRVLARLNHPNIVSVYDFGQTEHFYFLTMEFVDGVNLRQAMNAGRFSPGEALAIVPKICEALQYAHGQGILHRDIKPENILLDARGQVKIADFGIAKLVGEDHKADVTLTATGAALGTPHYMAPEQLEKPSEVDHRADIYSLGVVFYEMLTGELPIGRFAAPSAKTPVGANVDEVVFRTLEKDRERRYQSAGEMKTQVEHLTDAGAAAPPFPGNTPDAIKESLCHITTPEHARSFVGRFLYIHQGTGTLRLTPDTLSFERGWSTVTIPLRDIQALGIGQYSTWAKPVRLDYLVVTFREHGRVRSLFLTPVASRVAMNWDANRLTADWRQAVARAVQSVTGQPPAEPAAELRGASAPSPLVQALLFVSLTVASIAAAVGFTWWNKGRLPATGVEWLPVLLVVVPALGAMAWVLWRGRQATPPPMSRIPEAPAGTPAWSQKAIWGAVLTGLSLPLPVLSLALAYLAKGGRGFFGSVELLIFAGMAGLPGLAGVILGWMALNDLRAQPGRLRGLPLAVFAALMWPLALLVCGTCVAPLLLLRGSASAGGNPAFAAVLPFLILAAAIALAVWAVRAAARWAGNKPSTRQRGVLKWVFLALLLLGAGGLLLPKPVTPPAAAQLNVPPGHPPVTPHTIFSPSCAACHPPSAPRPAEARPAPGPAAMETNTTPWIRFTFTAVELREVAGVRWLAIDYVDDVHGDCQKSFPWETTIPGFKAETRMSEFVTDAKDSSPAVRHQRVEHRMPDSIRRDQLERVRDQVSRTLERKSFRLEPGEEKVLFEIIPMANGQAVLAPPEGTATEKEVTDVAKSFGSSLKARVKVTTPLSVPPANGKRASAELWSPKLAPGEKPDLQGILQEARRLAQEGRDEEALQRHIWYHNHALEIDPAQVGARVSFALAQWAELAWRYPKAEEALVEIRDRGVREFSDGGGGHYGLFHEVSAINRHLGQNDATLALFKSIQRQDPKLASQCYAAAEELLVENGDYALCASFIPDAQSQYKTLRVRRERLLEITDRTPEVNRAEISRQAQRTFIKNTRTLIEILVGTGRKTEAETIRDQAVAVLDVPELQSAVTDAEKRVASRSTPARRP